ncbi:hypothetical protein Hanom_Chr09g00776181 [Helianthus anomalus]
MVQNIIINPLANITTNLSVQYIPLFICFITRFVGIKNRHIIILNIKEIFHLAFPNMIIRTIQIHNSTCISFHRSIKFQPNNKSQWL